MDAHPVPQNVTSFEFRLVGDMTLKQFIYLAAGLGTAYLIFVLFAAKAPLVSWPLIVIFGLMGIAYAFVPIADRPLDHWTAAFFKAIYTPTKRVWRKNGKDLTNDPIFKNRLNVYLSLGSRAIPEFENTPSPLSVPQPIPAPIAPPPLPQVAPMPPVPQPLPTPIAPPPPPPPPPAPIAPPKPVELPSSEDLTKTVELGSQAQSLQVKIIETERELSQIKQQATENKADPHSYAPQFNSVFENLQKLTEEASGIKQQLANLTRQPANPTNLPPRVEVVKPSKPKATQPTLTTFPNVINGIVNDPNQNYLDGVVVVIHDKDNLPVRALKTNKLGQFTGSTPLPNGTYTIEMEKDGFSFDILKMDLDGKVLPPLLITARQIINRV
jgi:hypothetical protein